MAQVVTLRVVVNNREALASLRAVEQAANRLNHRNVDIRVNTSSVQAAQRQVQSFHNSLIDFEKMSGRVGASFAAVMGKVALWSSVTTLIYAPVRAMQSALATMKEVDSALVDIQKVTDLTDGQIKRLTKSSYELASAMGRTADEVLNQAVTFARAGYQDQIEDLAELGVLLQNVGDIEADTASSFIIAVDAAWQLHGSTEALMEVIDGLNNITNLNATDMDKMTSGVTVAASVFATAGESVQTFAAMLGTATAATQRSGSEMARGLRTIAMNIRQIRGEVEFEDGEVQLVDDKSIANASKALETHAGILTIENGELRKTSDVLDELAGKWGTLNSIQKEAIGEALAGKRQKNILDALMSNWDMYEKMLDDYANGTGSALRENELYIKSWEARLAVLSSTWTEFVSHMVNTDLIKESITLLTQFITILDSGSGQFLVIEVGMIALAKAVQMGTVALKEHIIALHAQTVAEQMAAVQVDLATAEQLEAALMAGELSQAEISAAFATGKLTKAQIEQAVAAGKLTPRQAALILGNTALEGSNLTLAASFKKLTATMLASPLFWAAAAGAAAYAFVKIIDATTVSAEEARNQLDDTNSKLEETEQEYDALIAKGEALNDKERTRLKLLEEQREILRNQQIADQKQLFRSTFGNTSTASNTIMARPGVMIKTDDAYAGNNLKTDVSESIRRYREAEESQRALDEAFDNNLITLEKYEKQSAKVAKTMENEKSYLVSTTLALEDYDDAVLDSIDGAREASDMLHEWTDSLGDTADAAGSAADAAGDFSSKVEISDTVVEALEKETARLNDEIDELQSTYETLTSAVDEYNSTGYLSVDTLQSLLSLEPKYLSLLMDENGQLSLNEGAFLDVVKAKITDEAESAKLEYATKLLQAAQQGDVDTLRNLISVQDEAATSTHGLYVERMRLLAAMSGEDADNAFRSAVAYSRQVDEMTKTAVNNLTTGAFKSASASRSSSRGSGSSGSTKTEDPYKEALDALQSYLNASESKIEDWERGNASSLQVVAKYKEMQNRIHALAEDFRAKGLTDDSEQIIKLKKLWWGYFDDIEDTFKGAMDDLDDKMSYSKTKIMDWENAGGNTDEIVAEYRKMMNETHELAEWYRSMGYDDTSEYIQDLKSQWWDYYHEIEDIQKSLVDELEKAVDEKLKEAAEERDRQLDALDAEEDALKAAREQEDALLELEEKRLAVMEAQKALLDASNERTVRQMQADGTWEWVADPRTIKEAQEQLEQAEKDLKEYEAEQAYQAALDEIDARRDAINAAYDAIEEEWDTILKSLQEPTRDIADILDDLAQNGTARMKEQVDNINDLLGKLGDYINGTINGGAFLEEGNGGGSGGGGGGGGSFRDYSGDTTDYSKKMMESTSWDEFNHWAAQRENKANAQGIDISGSTWKSNDQIKSEWLAAGGGSRPSAEKKPTASSTTTTKKTGSSSLNGSSEHPSERRTFDSGGIARGVGLMHKDTEEDEIVLGPELTKKLLAPVSDAEYWRSIEAMGWMWGNPKPASPGLPDSMRSETHNDRHDTSYYINGVQIGESEAHKPLSEILSTLALHANEY